MRKAPLNSTNWAARAAEVRAIEGPNANFSNALPKRNNESPDIGRRHRPQRASVVTIRDPNTAG